jgi:hypothetical protein
VQRQTGFTDEAFDFLKGRLRLLLTTTQDHKSSSPGESHPQALTEPDVNLSAHPAPIVQSQDEFRETIKQTSSVHAGQLALANEPLVVDGPSIA